MSSFEIVGQGPMDRQQRLNEEASLIEAQAINNPEAFGALRNQMFLLDGHSPIFHEPVRIIGTEIKRERNEAGIIDGPPYIDQSGGVDLVEGLYNGFDLVYFDDEDGEQVIKAVHIVQTGEELHSPMLSDSYVQHSHQFVCINGSVIESLEPRNAHYFEAITQDRIIRSLGTMIFSTLIGPASKFKRIARIINAEIEKDPFNYAMDLQRMSYLNSTGLLGNVAITTEKAVITTRDASGEFTRATTDPDTTVTFWPQIFHVDSTLQDQDSGSIVANREICVIGRGEDDETVCASLANIQSVEVV